MACNFDINFNGNAETLIEKANNAIASAGGTFTGDALNGSYSLATPLGAISGTYNVNGNSINFNITDKPFLLPCSRIEQELRKYLGVE